MASSRAPKHDFAPAWLKIPDTESHKSSGPKQAEHPADRGSRGRLLPRDHDYYDRRGYPPPPPPKNRHHSMDDDYYNAYYGYYGNGGGYNGWCGNGNFRSQLNRDPGGGKFGGPRYPPGPPMNGFRPPPPPPPPPPMGNGGGYYPYDCYAGYGGKDYCEPPYYHPAAGNNRPPPGPRRLYDAARNNSRADKENKHSTMPGPETKKKKEPNIEEDFPSLIGDGDPATPEVKTAKTLNSSGVWEKSPISKIKTPNANSYRSNGLDNPRDSVKHNTSNIYKALIPNKANLMKKGKESRDVNSNTSSPFSKINKEARIVSPTVDVLNTRTITQPKRLADKKSDFLKQLKMEGQPATNGDLNNAEQHQEERDDHLVNGVNDLSVEEESGVGAGIFSGTSLEAEQRLLKEMGWTEDEEEEYVITEDDKKEMQQLLKQRNGLSCRGRGLSSSSSGSTTTTTTNKTWSSPQHHAGVPIFHTPPPLTVSASSSSSSASSDDDDAGGGGDSDGCR